MVDKSQKKKSIFEPEYDEDYYNISFSGDVRRMTYSNDRIDKSVINFGNACTDKSVMERKSKDMKLWSLLWNFAEENNDEIDWSNFECKKYYIYCGNNHNWYVDAKSLWKCLTEIYFSSAELAHRAIDEIVIPYKNGEL